MNLGILYAIWNKMLETNIMAKLSWWKILWIPKIWSWKFAIPDTILKPFCRVPPLLYIVPCISTFITMSPTPLGLLPGKSLFILPTYPANKSLCCSLSLQEFDMFCIDRGFYLHEETEYNKSHKLKILNHDRNYTQSLWLTCPTLCLLI